MIDLEVILTFLTIHNQQFFSLNPYRLSLFGVDVLGSSKRFEVITNIVLILKKVIHLMTFLKQRDKMLYFHTENRCLGCRFDCQRLTDMMKGCLTCKYRMVHIVFLTFYILQRYIYVYMACMCMCSQYKHIPVYTYICVYH